MEDCNAYAGTFSTMRYYDGDLYMIDTEYEKTEDTKMNEIICLYRMKTDGSGKDKVCELATIYPDEIVMAEGDDGINYDIYWNIYRGYLYYAYRIGTTGLKDDTFHNNQSNYVMRIHLAHPSDKTYIMPLEGTSVEQISFQGSGSYVYFYDIDYEQLLKSTQNGRNVLFRKKCIVCILTSVLVSGIVMYRSFSFVCRTYGLKNLKYSVFSLDLFSDVWVDIPLWGMVVLLWICRIMAACSVSFIILWMSGRTKTLIESLVLNAAILIVPAGLVMMGFSKISVVSVLRPMMVTAHWNQYGFGNIVSILPLCVFVGIGILCLRLAKKKSV